MYKSILSGILLVLLLNNLSAQSKNSNLKEPEVGKPCPEFVFDKIDYYKSKNVSLLDLRGKWVILDFWSKNCMGCISSFSTISKEQKEFQDSVQFIMVSHDSTADERKIYAGYQSKLNLAMPSAFDTHLFRSFNVGLLP